MIEISNLTKRFAQHTAVDDLSFQVQRGEVLGFLGPNGAGKSTTMKMLTGFLAPTSGTARILGHDIRTQTLQAQRLIGYLPQQVTLFDGTIAENIARLSPSPDPDAVVRAATAAAASCPSAGAAPRTCPSTTSSAWRHQA